MTNILTLAALLYAQYFFFFSTVLYEVPSVRGIHKQVPALHQEINSSKQKNSPRIDYYFLTSDNTLRMPTPTYASFSAI